MQHNLFMECDNCQLRGAFTRKIPSFSGDHIARADLTSKRWTQQDARMSFHHELCNFKISV